MNGIPTFLRRGQNGDPGEPQPQPNVTPLPAVALRADPITRANEMGDMVASLIQERDQLREDRDFLKRHNESLSDQLTRCERERDYYIQRSRQMEYFNALVRANFHTIRTVMDSVQAAAEKAGLENISVPTPNEAPPSGEEIQEQPATEKTVLPEAKLTTSQQLEKTLDEYNRQQHGIENVSARPRSPT